MSPSESPRQPRVRILVVDDEPQFERLILQRFRNKVRSGEYDFVFAGNGQEALEMIGQDGSITMVLSDINMPVMDGLTLLDRIREIRPLLKTVMVSAYGDMKNIRTAMNLGAFDFVTKPIEFTDLEITIEKTLRETELVRQVEQAKELAERHERLQLIDQLKTQFFTDISHEFRTPLTVISGMIDKIEETPEKWLVKGVGMIRRNSQNLLQLVNQILDLRKLESGAMELRPTQGEVVSYLRYLFESFEAWAESRDLRMHFLGNVPELVMDYDPEKLLRIVSNLLDNAIKFTPEGGQIYLLVDHLEPPGQLQFRVKDTGVGISADALPGIFERFFQGNDGRPSKPRGGTGIGLSLCRELVRLMNGEISVESQEGKGTTFTVKLPVLRQAPKAEEAPEAGLSALNLPALAGLSDWVQHPDVDAELPQVLIVEDNPDVAHYLQACLEGLYRLTLATDGEQGIERALEDIPDLILSDVMMPGKDGFELCQILKNDERTSHIPIVLLTAKADVESRIAGLQRGADAYLAKPFDRQELLVRLDKLLELRATLQSRYRSTEALPAADDEGANLEDRFVLKLRQAVEENLEDEDFGILQLCKFVGMSRTSLHRKIKALTGRSTSAFIRIVRLERARVLLNTTDLNISQVAYEVGFKDPKYFSSSFKEIFGETPRSARPE